MKKIWLWLCFVLWFLFTVFTINMLIIWPLMGIFWTIPVWWAVWPILYCYLKDNAWKGI
jgi:hypothetical protein